MNVKPADVIHYNSTQARTFLRKNWNDPEWASVQIISDSESSDGVVIVRRNGEKPPVVRWGKSRVVRAMGGLGRGFKKWFRRKDPVPLAQDSEEPELELVSLDDEEINVQLVDMRDPSEVTDDDYSDRSYKRDSDTDEESDSDLSDEGMPPTQPYKTLVDDNEDLNPVLLYDVRVTPPNTVVSANFIAQAGQLVY